MPRHRNDERFQALSRRAVLKAIGAASIALAGSAACADQSVRLPFAGAASRPHRWRRAMNSARYSRRSGPG